MLHKLGIVERMMILYHSAALLISKSPRDYIESCDPKAKTICTWASSLVGLLWLKNSVSARCLF
jgi:hypothetical protein